MEFPPIEVPVLGRSGLIALIALLHIPFFVNFVMGAPVIAVVAEWLGKRSGDTRYDRLSRDLSFMALVTVGIGALGGVGLVATNIGLFPKFFTAGATIFFWPLVLEIGAFLTEAIGIAVYRYTWDKHKHKTWHMVVGLIGAFGAWLSGLIINALASFMLTPGRWPETHSLWDAAFNPSSLPSYLHRAVAALSITGFFLIVYAIWNAWRAKDEADKGYATWALRFGGKWAVIATALQFLPGAWYLLALQSGTANAAPEGSVVPKLLGGPLTFFWFGGIVLAAFSVLAVWFLAVQSPSEGIKRTGRLVLIGAVILILTTNAFMGFTRERARKPYLVYGVMYGNQMMANFLPSGAADAVEPAPAGASQADAMAIFQDAGCALCHGIGGSGGAIALDGVGAKLSSDEINDVLTSPPAGMPAFQGSESDLQTLAAFLAEQK